MRSCSRREEVRREELNGSRGKEEEIRIYERKQGEGGVWMRGHTGRAFVKLCDLSLYRTCVAV